MAGFYPGVVVSSKRACGGALHPARCLLLALCVLSVSASAEESWPVPHLPNGLETFAIGQQMNVNGLPMRLRGFISPLAPAELLPALRKSLGDPLVEDHRGARQVLGRAEGNYYITVQVEGTDSGSRGTVAVADIAGALKGHPGHRNNTARWLDRLPAGSTITSDLSSDEGGRTSQHLVFVNQQGPLRNRDGLMALMKSDGYRLEREVAAAPGAVSTAATGAGAGTLYFSAPGKEAMAVVARSGESTSVVLNIVTMLSAYK